MKYLTSNQERNLIMQINKILTLQVSELPESDQIIINQISGLTKALNIKLDKLNESLDSLEIKQEPKENQNDIKNKK